MLIEIAAENQMIGKLVANQSYTRAELGALLPDDVARTSLNNVINRLVEQGKLARSGPDSFRATQP